jgi:hypothetical protein
MQYHLQSARYVLNRSSAFRRSLQLFLDVAESDVKALPRRERHRRCRVMIRVRHERYRSLSDPAPATIRKVWRLPLVSASSLAMALPMGWPVLPS